MALCSGGELYDLKGGAWRTADWRSKTAEVCLGSVDLGGRLRMAVEEEGDDLPSSTISPFVPIPVTTSTQQHKVQPVHPPRRIPISSLIVENNLRMSYPRSLQSPKEPTSKVSRVAACAPEHRNPRAMSKINDI